MNRIVEINNDQFQRPNIGNNVYTNRAEIARVGYQNISEVTVVVTAYNRLEKTKRCVESLLKYSQGIDYDLILIDNGSTDETFAYFKSVSHPKKTILRMTQNMGAYFPTLEMDLRSFAKYVCFVANDLILTENWLSNLLACIKSDPKIGMVNPVCSNTSNLQCVEFQYETYDEMHKLAKAFNQSDPRKWEDRLRLITLGTVYRKDALLALGWPLGDVGFFHDFGDDDITFRMRRMGYRAVLAGDTWICHDHKHAGEGKDPVEFQQSLAIGRQNFRDKYFGIDAWDDANNFYIPFCEYLPKKTWGPSCRILGVDVKCGTPILDIKNWLRKSGVFEAELSAFTQDPKYWLDLKTICVGSVACDREEFLTDYFPKEYFDFVVVDQPLNHCHEPQKMIDDMLSLCKSGGVVLCKVKNAFNFKTYIHMLAQDDVYEPEFSYNIPTPVIQDIFTKRGTSVTRINYPIALNESDKGTLYGFLPTGFTEEHREKILNNMLIDYSILLVTKP